MGNVNGATNRVLVWIAGVLGAIIASLAVAAAIGGYGAVQEATTELRVLNANMANVVGQITELKSDLNNVKQDLKAASGDRWTKADHDRYATDRDRKDAEQDSRLDRLERGRP